MQLLDYIVVAAVSGWLITAVSYIIRQRRRGRCVSCGCGASACAGCTHRCTSAAAPTIEVKRHENPRSSRKLS